MCGRLAHEPRGNAERADGGGAGGLEGDDPGCRLRRQDAVTHEGTLEDVAVAPARRPCGAGIGRDDRRGDLAHVFRHDRCCEDAGDQEPGEIPADRLQVRLARIRRGEPEAAGQRFEEGAGEDP